MVMGVIGYFLPTTVLSNLTDYIGMILGPITRKILSLLKIGRKLINFVNRPISVVL